jgi:hypothetical protein
MMNDGQNGKTNSNSISIILKNSAWEWGSAKIEAWFLKLVLPWFLAPSS